MHVIIQPAAMARLLMHMNLVLELLMIRLVIVISSIEVLIIRVLMMKRRMVVRPAVTAKLLILSFVMGRRGEVSRVFENKLLGNWVGIREFKHSGSLGTRVGGLGI